MDFGGGLRALGAQAAIMTTRDELYAKFGRAAEAAQLFETELGSILLGIRALQEGWHVIPGGEQARIEWEKVNASTVGKLLHRLKKSMEFDEELEARLASALEARNRLIHGFFLKHRLAIQTSNGRQVMVDDLEALHAELSIAWRQTGAITKAVVDLINKRQRHD